MLKLSLIALFVMSMATLTIAASAIPAEAASSAKSPAELVQLN